MRSLPATQIVTPPTEFISDEEFADVSDDDMSIIPPPPKRCKTVHPEALTTKATVTPSGVSFETIPRVEAIVNMGEDVEIPDTDPTALLHPFFVTLTYPGGLTDSQVNGWGRYLESTYGPPYWIYVFEGGSGTSKHEHLHAVIWQNESRRTDVITRGIRGCVYSPNDLNALSSQSRLVVTRRCTHLSGSLRYILKDVTSNDQVTANLPPGSDIETILSDARGYWEKAKATATADNSLFPESGTIRTVPPSQVSDFLFKASQALGIGTGHSFAFAELVAACFSRGIRFDLRNLRSYRLGLELVAAAQDPGKALLYEIEYRSTQ